MYHFDPQRRLMTTVDAIDGPGDGDLVVRTKGAPEEVLRRSVAVLRDDGQHDGGRHDGGRHDGGCSPLDEVRRREILDALAPYAGTGLRLIAVADRVLAPGVGLGPRDRDAVEAGLTFLGVVALLDPPRPEVADAVHDCHAAGIRILVVTGDHPLTAAEIARRVGIGGDALRVVNAADMDRMSEPELDRLVAGGEEIVFARSSPRRRCAWRTLSAMPGTSWR